VTGRRRFAQHFLEPAWVAKVVAAVDPRPDDRILEIGPGRGALTLALAASAARVAAVEVDRDLASRLEARHVPNLTVVTADVLTVDLPSLVRAALDATPEFPIRVVGNLPYNISSPILFRLLEAAATSVLRDATLTLQKEFADRLLAVRGTADYGVLTLTTALRADVRRLLSLPPGAFRPAPKVASTLVRLWFRPPPPEVHDAALVTAIVRAMFTERRKTLANALASFARSRPVSALDALHAAGIDPRRRPETLRLGEVARLADAFEGRD
jgi:16S rRNA (adenine1518-N6/adenine1519-N6)-dimethyltransferase